MTRHWAMSLFRYGTARPGAVGYPMAVRVVDHSPLTAPVTTQEVAAFRAHAKASGAPCAAVNVSTVSRGLTG